MGEAMAMDPVIAQMPRGGPTASWLDRRLQTDALEYTDRYDIPDEVKQTVITALDRVGSRTGQHEKHARMALDVVADIPNPRVRTQVVDATAIAADNHTYDLVVFAQAFHHLPPATAVRAIAEATRVGRRFLVIDLKRPSPLGLILTQLLVAPLAAVALLVRPSFRRIMHDGFISALRAYSHSAFLALAKAADPQMHIEFLPTAARFGSNRPPWCSPGRVRHPQS